MMIVLSGWTKLLNGSGKKYMGEKDSDEHTSVRKIHDITTL